MKQIIIICDKCGTKVDTEGSAEEIFKAQEYFHIYHDCGYGSVFGDGNEIELDICQNCMNQLLGDAIKKKLNSDQ